MCFRHDKPTISYLFGNGLYQLFLVILVPNPLVHHLLDLSVAHLRRAELAGPGGKDPPQEVAFGRTVCRKFEEDLYS